MAVHGAAVSAPGYIESQGYDAEPPEQGEVALLPQPRGVKVPDLPHRGSVSGCSAKNSAMNCKCRLLTARLYAGLCHLLSSLSALVMEQVADVTMQSKHRPHISTDILKYSPTLSLFHHVNCAKSTIFMFRAAAAAAASMMLLP